MTNPTALETVCPAAGQTIPHTQTATMSAPQDAATVPADRYDDFCRFRRRIVDTEQTPVLLARRAPPAS